jgi:cold shock CspA family protein
MSERVRGRVKFWHDRNYGFVAPDDPAMKDHFTHVRMTRDRRPLVVGDVVSFRSERDPNREDDRFRAVDVEVMEAASDDDDRVWRNDR